MNTTIRSICTCMLIVGLLASCATITTKEDQATRALLAFFDQLAEGDYEAAAGIYGGSYETLVTFNPDLDPDDPAALLQRGCQVNGLQCLPVRIATFNEVTPKGEYIFTVEFSNPDGSLFVLDACCGDDPATPPVFQFEYRVVEGGDEQFLVLDLPIYVP